MAATLTIVNQHGQSLATHRLGDAPLAIRAQDQVHYQLAGEGGLAPAHVETARAGNDLLVNIDGEAALRIEDYFLLDDTGLKNPLLGLNGNGQYVAYPLAETSALPVEHVLAEEVALASSNSGISPLAALVTIGGVALTGAVLAGSGKNDAAETPQQPQTPFDPKQPAPPAPNPPADNNNTPPPPSGNNPPPSGGGNNPPPSGGGNNPPPSGGGNNPPPANRAPTDITLSAETLPENQTGAVVGKLATTDPDAGDTHSYTVNDQRFEVDAQGNLKLKDGVKVEFAQEQTISLEITTTDKAGAKYSETITLQVEDDPNYPAPTPPQNHAPTDIALSADKLPENKLGAVIGKLTTTDEDQGDTHTYTVNDPRFEVTADGTLKLKDGVKVDFADGQTIPLTITTTDKGGKSHQETFTINVEDDPAYPAPNPPAPPAANETARVGIVGLAQVGKTLAAKVTDGNGFNEANVQYQWFADERPIAGATDATYRLTAADEGKNFSVMAQYTDHAGHREAPVSDLTPTVITPKGNTYLPKPASDYVVSVKDGAFAAKGDGQTNDTAAIQKAIDLVSGKGGGVVEIPGGTYMIDALVSLQMRSNVTLKLADDAILQAIPNDSREYAIITFDRIENAHITGGTLIGDRHEHGNLLGEWGHGVAIYSSKNIVVENVVARDFWGDGFSVGRSWGTEQQSENIIFNQLTGDNNRRQVVFVSDGKNIKILNSLISNVNGTSPQAGIDIEPNQDRQIDGVEVRGNIFEGNVGFGLLVSMVTQKKSWVKNVVVEDNLFKNNERAIALWGLTGGRIANNTIHHDGDERMPFGITVSEHTSGVTVENNTIYGGGINPRFKSAEYNTIGKNEFKSGVFIFGDPKVGEALTARVIDADNPQTEYVIFPKHVKYQWYAEDVAIEGATASTYTPTEADKGKTLTVQVAFTDGSDNAETAESRPTLPVDSTPPNRSPINLDFEGHDYPQVSIPEGKPGAAIVKIATIDPDPRDTHTYYVRDERFEVKDGVLKLKDGVKIDYEHEKTVYLVIYTYDQNRASFGFDYTLPVTDDPNYHGKVNQKPTDLLISNETVMENRPGAIVGKLIPVDADNDGFYTYYFSDNRFTEKDGYLKLRDGVILEHGGRSIPVTATVADSGDNTLQRTFFIRVQDDPDWPANRPGQVQIEGQAKTGQTLTASVVDPDGEPDNIQYQWHADGEKIAGATSADYTVQAGDLGKQLTAQARYTDHAGHSETAESPRTFPVTAASGNAKPLTVRLEPELNLDNLDTIAHGTDGQDIFVIDGQGVKIIADLATGDTAISPPPLAGEGQGGGGNHSPLAGQGGSSNKTPTITGFNLSHGDLLQLESKAFTALEKGTLAETAFATGDKATTADHRVIYNAKTGELAYDPDGSGAAAATIIARLDPALELEAQHIQII